MSWQEELRQLDEELAAGQISADDYRVRRDRVLASAVNAGSESAPSGPDSEATQIVPPVAPPSGPPPAAPQQQAPQQQPQQQHPGTGAQPAPDPNATQQVHSQVESSQSRQAPQPGFQGNQEPERTQVVPNYPQSPPYGIPGQQNQPPYNPQSPPPGWSAFQQESAPPWGGGEFPPLAPPGGASEWSGRSDWSAQQGPEDGGGKKSSSKRTPIIIAVVVVVLLLIGGGVYLFGFANKGGDNTANGGGTPTTQAAPSTTPWPTQPNGLTIPQLPGKAGVVEEVKSFSDVVRQAALTSSENDVYTSANAGQARMAVSNLPNDVNVVVLTVLTPSANAAGDATKELAQLQSDFGLQPYSGTQPPGVQIGQLAHTSNGRALIRGHYTSGKTVVRVHVDGADLASIEPVFDQILSAQLQALPADG